jgi:Na+-translocating ferredoxin:NAD+ oxidoreductase RnfE subunit
MLAESLEGMEALVVVAVTNRTVSMSTKTTAGIKIRIFNMILSLFVRNIQIKAGRALPAQSMGGYECSGTS